MIRLVVRANGDLISLVQASPHFEMAKWHTLKFIHNHVTLGISSDTPRKANRRFPWQTSLDDPYVADLSYLVH